MTEPTSSAHPLSEAHRRMLEVGSGLRPATIEARGYRTVRGAEGAAELAALGFNKAQAATANAADVLLVPMYGADGTVVSHQVRPDAPRVTKSSKTPLKYETAAGRGNRLDVPPAGRELVMDGTSPLWVTEGAKTADALAQAGVGVLMLAGVWGFMGRAALNQGTAVIGDLFGIPMESRLVYLAYDSDVVTKEGVQAAERRLAEVLGARGAQVLVVRIPAGENGTKVGADDYLAAGGTLEALTTAATPPPAADPLGGQHPYNFAYDLAQEGFELALDSTGAFLLRPIDEHSAPTGPARRYSRDQLRERIISLAGDRRAAHAVTEAAAKHAVARLAGDRVDTPAPLAPAHIAQTPGATWVDMGTSYGTDVVAISATGWGYAPWADVPHWIVRDEQVHELGPPAPAEQRSWEPLAELLGLDEAGFAVVRTWLVAVLAVRRVPLLWWRGEPGCGKSTRAELVCRVLGLPGLDTMPRDKQAALSTLQTSPWLGVENLGSLAPAISDLWCTAVTEGVVSDRVLYTQRNVRTLGRWTGMITSVSDVGGALDDLMSRALTIDLPPAAHRRTRTALLATLDQHLPAVRGALFDDAAKVMAMLAEWDGNDTGTYRFPDLTTVARALDVLHGGGHADALTEAADTVLAERSDEDPWVAFLVDLVRRNGGRWVGTSAELLAEQHKVRRLVTFDADPDGSQWPTSPSQVGRWLPMRAGRLRAKSVRWEKLPRKRLERGHVLTITDRIGDESPRDEGQASPNASSQTPSSTPLCDTSDTYDTSSQESIGRVKKREDVEVPSTPSYKSVGAENPTHTSQPSLQAADLRFSGDRGCDDLDGARRACRAWVVDRLGAVEPCSIEAARTGLIDSIRSTGSLTVDVETTGYPVGHADHRLRTVQLGGAETAWVFDVREGQGVEPVRALVRDFLAVAPRLHAHSATADLVPLVAAGLAHESAWARMFDTVIPAKLADPASTGADPGLKRLSAAVLGEAAVSPAADTERASLFKRSKWRTNTTADTPVERSGWAQVDPGDPVMLRYAAADVLDCAAIAGKLPTIPADLHERERAVARATARVAHRGLPIDGPRVARLLAEHTERRDEAAAAITELGIENPGSDRQVAAALAGLGVNLPFTPPSTRYPNGQPSVAAGVLDGLLAASGGTPGSATGLSEASRRLIELVLAHRHHDTVVGTFLSPYHQLVTRGDGRARPTVYTLGTDTGRMSCVRPNLQQLPREGGVRACITADEGELLISADFSGVEVRVMAALSQDPHLIKIITEGADLHAIVAEQAFGPGWTKADRYTAKRGVFGWAYGGGVPSLARQVGVGEHIMAAIVDSLALVAPTYVAWAAELKRQVRAGATHFPTYAGRIIHLPHQSPHKAPNYAVQGTARELLVDAIARWETTRWAGGVIMPIHDEILAPVPAADADAASAALVEAMTTELYRVPILAEASQPSKFWQDAT